jgi:alkanesulfonate monooxygenase SsuD/methylene tetrahydromethanopterin reductase-like flavin-dependent oxidoreductase (luciferase family)
MTAPLRLSLFSVQDHYPERARSLATFYAETLAQAELADRLGYDTFFVAEHHFHPYGVVPNPPVLLAAMAMRTTRLRLGPAIAVLPFHHPINLAESYAMLDVLSAGRLVLGVGSGYLKHEFAGYGIDPAEKRERFDEALALLKRALAGEEISHQGRFHALAGVRINVRPLQATVPIYVAVLNRLAAFHVGKQGNRMMSVPYASVDRFAEVGALAADFAQGCREAGAAQADAASDTLFAFHTHVADSDAACRHEAAEAFDLYVATRLYAKSQTYDDIERSGLALFGSVETVADKLAALHRMGVRHVVALMNFGLMPAPRVELAMARLMHAALPLALRKLG